ncbi:MAG: bifunctional phosphopantothenoylcysteine decarboxylase/phosphopantothenate--cysteine ligase CoaBC [Erysipelotrichaceae bacterium]|nr:bifunctional phosphopantothenoylcysteine decarboxylase/phosphopantothenate--cysteine ligase CoaBC [Erysipelotrichaceae bacterium]
MKTVIVGISSSVAAFKSVQLVSDLLKEGLDVEVIETKNATEFVTPLQFSSLTKHKTYVNTFDRVENYDVEHISLAKKADVFIVAPATANVIAKLANGIAEDMLTTTFLACDCEKIIAPAMNTKMYENPITQENIEKLKKYGVKFVEPATGLLACGDEGKGKLASVDDLKEAVLSSLREKKLAGRKVLITAGPTMEAIDPVRFISNHSSGKQGYALAKAAKNLGAEVTLVSGPVSIKEPYGVNTIKVKSALEMFEEVKKHFDEVDYVVMSAAVADYRPKNVASQKLKKSDDDMSIELVRNPDILKYLGEHKTKQKICGFAMETENQLENATKKFFGKNCDLLVLNDLFEKGAGFKGDTNVVTLITKENNEKLEMMSKEELSYVILNKLMEV